MVLSWLILRPRRRYGSSAPGAMAPCGGICFRCRGWSICSACLPVPIALLCGAAPETAWLFASLWVLKLAQNSPGFAQLGRVFVLEAKPLASVLVLFLIVLFLASAAMHVVERDESAVVVRYLAVVAVVGGGHADHDRLRRRGSAHGARPSAGRRRDDLRHRHVRFVDRRTGHRLCRRDAGGATSSKPGTWSARCRFSSRSTLPRSPRSPICCAAWKSRSGPPSSAAAGSAIACISLPPAKLRSTSTPTPVRLGVGAFFGELALLGDIDPHRECLDDQGVDAAGARPGRFPHADGASFRACPRDRCRRQKTPWRHPAPARVASAWRHRASVNISDLMKEK